MARYDSPGLGITVHAPAYGEFTTAPELTPGQLFGLDTEGPYQLGAGIFAEGYHLRTIQIATKSVAWVFNVADPAQLEFATGVLAHMDNSFCSHTNHDTVSLYKVLGLDISLRNVDTRMLATMAAPDDREGGNDLKTLARGMGMSWLNDAQARLQKRFEHIVATRNEGIMQDIHASIEDRFEGVAETKEITQQKKERGYLVTQAEKDEFAWSAIPIDDPDYNIYAGLDAVACRRAVLPLVEKTRAPASLIKMETWADAQAAQWRMRGYRIDTAAHRTLWESASKHCEMYAEKFGELAFEQILKSPVRNPHYVSKPISPRSGKKVAAYLREHGADFTGHPLTKTGQKLADDGKLTYAQEISGEYASMSKKHRMKLEALTLDEEGREALEYLIEFKDRVYTVTKMEEVAKVLSPESRIHPTLRTVGAVTGRTSSSGPNSQNWGKKAVEMREIIVPDDGNVFIACDFDQIELRVVAALARVKSMIEVIIDGGDLHMLTATLAQCTRDIAKIVAFLIVYGGGAKALNAQTGIPLDRCYEIIKTYKQGVPEIVAYADKLGKEKVEIRTISGRKIPVGKDKTGEPRSYANVNYDVQSAGRELAFAAWWRYQHDPERRGEAVMFVHDELVAEVPLEHYEHELVVLRRAFSFDFMGVPISGGACVLADKTGRSRWTSVDAAERYQEHREEYGIAVHA